MKPETAAIVAANAAVPLYSITDKGRAKLGAMCACDTYKKEPRP